MMIVSQLKRTLHILSFRTLFPFLDTNRQGEHCIRACAHEVNSLVDGSRIGETLRHLTSW